MKKIEQKNKKKLNKKLVYGVITALYVGFIGGSYFMGFTPGKQIAGNFWEYTESMFKVLPFAFILIALFEVWVKRETVEKHLGENAGAKSYFWALILGGMTIGPMLVALPAAHSLHQKGARLSVIFSYIGAASICRIPMTIFEASYLGLKFTLVRYAVAIPLVILTSIGMGKYYQKKGLTVQTEKSL